MLLTILPARPAGGRRRRPMTRGAADAARVAALAALASLTVADAGRSARGRGRAVPPPLPARPVAFPPYQIKTLANGLQVLVVLHHEQPSVSFRLLVRAGAMQEPADKPGVASFVASLLNQGTTTKSAEEIANAIESAGGVIGVGSGNELSFVNGAVIKDQMDLVLGLASDMVRASGVRAPRRSIASASRRCRRCR